MLAVAGGKGGCGKTTTTLGLALAAGRRGDAVLAVDADVDVPDLHRVAGVEAPDHHHAAGSDAPNRRRPGVRPPTGGAVGSTTEPRPVPGSTGVGVLPARAGTAPDELGDRLVGTGERYGLVLLDCPAGAGRDAAIPLRRADRTLLVTTDATPSLRDAAKTAAMARAVGTPVAGAVVTRSRRVPAGVPELLDCEPVVPVPPLESPLRAPRSRRQYDRVLERLPRLGRGRRGGPMASR